MKKQFKDTGLAKFLGKIITEVPELASDVFKVATSPNPIGSGLQVIVQKIKNKAETDKNLKSLVLEYEINFKNWEKEVYALENKDRESARNMYKNNHETSDKIAHRVMKYNLPMILILVAINILCIKYLDKTLLAIVSNVIGMVLQALINERQTIINFFFGSSFKSKISDSTKKLFNKQ